MSSQKVSPTLKAALWKGHDGKCFYCKRPVRWDELCVDHIIPEYLAEKPAKLAEVLRHVGLSMDWSLWAVPNLVPSCRRCNDGKHDRISAPNQMILLLGQAAEKAPRVDFLRQQIKEDRRIDRVKMQLELALALGKISEFEVNNILAAAAAGEDLFRLTAGIKLFEEALVDELQPSRVEKLLDKPVKLGTELPEGLTLSHEDGSVVNVRTVREYRSAVDAGYFGMTTFDMKMEAYFLTASGALTALAASRPSNCSFIRAPRVGLCDLDLIPSSILIRFGEEFEDDTAALVAHPTIGELIAAEHARVAGVTSSLINIEFAGMQTVLREILRADLDGDGIEDMLINRYLKAISGTLGLGLEPIALARRSFSEPFKVTEMKGAGAPE